jgi:hypothetical protein
MQIGGSYHMDIQSRGRCLTSLGGYHAQSSVKGKNENIPKRVHVRCTPSHNMPIRSDRQIRIWFVLLSVLPSTRTWLGKRRYRTAGLLAKLPIQN